MIRFENVTKEYSRRGKSIQAFCGQSLEIPTGDYVAIVGPSGSGKTTLLSMLGGMLSPSMGTIWIDGVSLYDLSIAHCAKLRRDKIGFVFQTFNLVPYLTAVENVQVPLFLAGASKRQQRGQAIALLEQVGLEDRLNHKPHELSTGQQQRVALARTMANEPEVILADEPTGNLDPESRERVLHFFDALNRKNRTIVMVTHDAIAAARAKRRLLLGNGAIVSSVAEAA